MGEEFPGSIGKVAKRELGHAGITTFAELARWTEKDLLAIHGVGPKAIRILGEALAERGLSYKSPN